MIYITGLIAKGLALISIHFFNSFSGIVLLFSPYFWIYQTINQHFISGSIILNINIPINGYSLFNLWLFDFRYPKICCIYGYP